MRAGFGRLALLALVLALPALPLAAREQGVGRTSEGIGGNAAGAASASGPAIQGDTATWAGEDDGGYGQWYPSRYGAGDTLGAAREITAERVVEAVRLVTRGEVYDLGRVTEPGIPVFGDRYWRQTIVSSDLYRQQNGGAGGQGENRLNHVEERVSGTYQVGTQLDGLNHLMIGDRFYNGHRAADILEPWGTSVLGVEGIPPFVTRGLLLDIAALKDVERLPAGYVISVADIEAALARAGLAVRSGDVVLFHTGWGGLWGQDAATFTSGEPGPGIAAARWLAERRVAATGADTWTFGPVPAENPNRPFEVPQYLNAVTGTYVFENLATEGLAREGINEFLFVNTHHKTRGSTAASVAPAAVR